MAGVRASMSLMKAKLDPARRAVLTEEFKSETDAFNAQIRELLGEENHAAFQQFEKTIPERTMLAQFNSRSAKPAAALSPDQQAALLQALSEARAHYLWTTELSRRNQAAGALAVMFSEDALDTFAQEEAQFDRQFLTQAQRILSSEQLASFENLQERQRQSQIAQLKTAAKLFAAKGR